MLTKTGGILSTIALAPLRLGFKTISTPAKIYGKLLMKYPQKTLMGTAGLGLNGYMGYSTFTKDFKHLAMNPKITYPTGFGGIRYSVPPR